MINIQKSEESIGYQFSIETKHGTHDQSSHGRRGGGSGRISNNSPEGRKPADKVKPDRKYSEDELDDWSVDMEDKHPSLITLGMSYDQKNKFRNDFESGKYKWSFRVVDTEDGGRKLDRQIDTMKERGFGVYYQDDNYEQSAVIYNKPKAPKK